MLQKLCQVSSLFRILSLIDVSFNVFHESGEKAQGFFSWLGELSEVCHDIEDATFDSLEEEQVVGLVAGELFKQFFVDVDLFSLV